MLMFPIKKYITNVVLRDRDLNSQGINIENSENVDSWKNVY